METQKYIKHSNIFLITLILIFMLLISCSSSDDDGDLNTNCNNWTEQYLAQANAFSEASNVYTNDPTLVNCQNYKAAGLNYVNALESVIDCVPMANSQAYIHSLNEYRAEVNAIECN